MSIFELKCRFSSLSTKSCNRTEKGSLENDVLQCENSRVGRRIHCIQTCIQTPYIATAGSDTIQVWNYATGELVISKEFACIPLSTSFHPSGLHMLIVFMDEVQCVHICVDELKIFWRMPIRSCRCCAFSNGGQSFALADNNLIQIFNFLSGEKTINLKGHNSKVVNILWVNGDQDLITHDEMGVIYLWNVTSASREKECIQFKSCPDIKYVHIGPDKMWLLKDSHLHSISSLAVDGIVDDTPNFGGPLLSSNEPMSFCIATLDRSTECSSLRIYDTITREFVDLSFEDKISAISLSSKDNYLIVGFESGTISVYNFVDLRGSRSLLTELPNLDTEMVEEPIVALANKVYLQEKEAALMDLCTIKKEMQEDYVYRTGLKILSQNEELARLKDCFRDTSDKVALALQTLEDVIKKIKRRHKTEAESQASMARTEVDTVERESEAKLLSLSESYDDVKANVLIRIDVLNLDKQHLSKSNERAILHNVTEWKNKHKEQLAICNELGRNISKSNLEYKECVSQIENEVDSQIETATKDHREKLSRNREATLKASSENGIMHKRFVALERHIEDQKETIKILLSREEDMHDQVKRLEESAKELSNNYDETTFNKKTKTVAITRLSNRKKDLDKFQYVLDEKLNDIKNSLGQNDDTNEFKKAIGEKAKYTDDLRRESIEIEGYIVLTSKMVTSVHRDISTEQKFISAQRRRYKIVTEWLLKTLDCIQNTSELSNCINQMPLHPVIAHTLHIVSDDAYAKRTVEQKIKSEEGNALKKGFDENRKGCDAIQMRQQMEYDSIRNQNQEKLHVIKSKRQELTAVRLQIQRFDEKNCEHTW
jgi:WD40 repeat protein